MTNYTDSEVVNIIGKYVDLTRVKNFYLNNSYNKKTEFSRKRTAIEDIEKSINELKKVTSMELRQMLPINLKSLEELCKQALTIHSS